MRSVKKAESIVEEENLDLSFGILQELHEDWKETGPGWQK